MIDKIEYGICAVVALAACGGGGGQMMGGTPCEALGSAGICVGLGFDVCDAVTLKCIKQPTCTKDSDCTEGFACRTGGCSRNCNVQGVLALPFDCQVGWTCEGTTGVCKKATTCDPTKTTNCNGQVCNTTTKVCDVTECSDSSTCGGYACVSERAPYNYCAKSCSDGMYADSTCAIGYRCDTMTSTCKKVTTACDPAAGAKDCNGPVCDATTKMCAAAVPCTGDDKCGNFKCYKNTGTTDTTCHLSCADGDSCSSFKSCSMMNLCE